MGGAASVSIEHSRMLQAEYDVLKAQVETR